MGENNLTPEERFERIENTLDRMAAESAVGRAESDARFSRIEINLELLQDFMSQSAQRFEQRFEKVEAQLEQLGDKLDRLGDTVTKLADTVVSLVRVFDNHTRDGHGGKRKKG
jgi:archaellum component FlaC